MQPLLDVGKRSGGVELASAAAVQTQGKGYMPSAALLTNITLNSLTLTCSNVLYVRVAFK